jgi:DNA-binding LytR/AlgR family response regulator
MKKIKCLIVDDEPLAIRIVEEYVKKTPYLQLVAGCDSAIEAMKVLQDKEIELIFLDIQMPELNGLDFSKTLKNDIKIIFTTAFPDYAIEGYKVNAAGYLLKPFSYPEFLEVVDRVKKNLESEPKIPVSEKQLNSFFVKSGYQTVRIEPDKILYFEGLKDYVKIFIKGQTSPIVTLMNMKSINDFLPVEQFVRIHRSYVVNIKQIDVIEKGSVKIDGKTIPISEGQRETFHQIIAKNLLSR